MIKVIFRHCVFFSFHTCCCIQPRILYSSHYYCCCYFNEIVKPISRLGGVLAFIYPSRFNCGLSSCTIQFLCYPLFCLSFFCGLGHFQTWPIVFMAIFGIFPHAVYFVRAQSKAKGDWGREHQSCGVKRWLRNFPCINFQIYSTPFLVFPQAGNQIFLERTGTLCKWKGKLQIYANIPLSNICIYECVYVDCVLYAMGFGEFFRPFILFSVPFIGVWTSFTELHTFNIQCTHSLAMCLFNYIYPIHITSAHPSSCLLSFARDKPILVPLACLVRVTNATLNVSGKL